MKYLIYNLVTSQYEPKAFVKQDGFVMTIESRILNKSDCIIEFDLEGVIDKFLDRVEDVGGTFEEVLQSLGFKDTPWFADDEKFLDIVYNDLMVCDRCKTIFLGSENKVFWKTEEDTFEEDRLCVYCY